VVANIINGQMDFFSTSTEPSNATFIKHVHCWHTEEMFSKFQFGQGKYDKTDFTPQADMATIRDYIAVVAVSSVRIGPVMLGKLATDDDYASKIENWRRLKP
jgi:hypothetical protein